MQPSAAVRRSCPHRGTATWLAAAALWLLPLVPSGAHAHPAAGLIDIPNLVEAHAAAVVHVVVRAADKPPRAVSVASSFGTGMVVSSEGHIITNAHVVAGEAPVFVRAADGREWQAQRLGVDEASDVALLRVPALDLPQVRAAPLSSVRVGETVVAIGYPLDRAQTVTAGIVSARDRRVDGLPMQFLQTDAAINPGNSGGPLFNGCGQVIGMNSRIWGRTGTFAGMAFAIPIETALQIAEDLRQTAEAGEPPGPGAVRVSLANRIGTCERSSRP